MFEQVALRLLEGAFICESSSPEAFRWLSTENAQEDISEFLDKIGRCLAKTQNDQAYYVTWKRIGQNERTEVKRIFASIKQTFRPLIHFITLCMEAEKKDISPAPGDRLEYAMLLKAVTENAHLLEVLREFGMMGKEFTVTEASAKGMLDKVIQQMERWGYLVLVNREQESYRFTGKLDYYYQIIDFLMENEGITDPSSQEQEDMPEQRRLV
ncbi:MAG TPA: hypothetical protein VIH29_05505 [Gallionella sp.]